MKRLAFHLAGFLFLCPLILFSQQHSSGAIRLKLKKLNFLGSVLYVAAHPDDENTRIIAAMANDRLAATAYLSMTRGDGGQNLIGPEIRDQLGLIRTQELLSARRLDGGQQFFTRANDFGYSKNAEETFSIWGKDSILHDVIKVFRQFQPDVIITRFPADERAGHGHHTASAMLAQEAFDLAARKDIFPQQVSQFGTWQVTRLYTNTGRWWNNTINENTPGIVSLDVGGYSPLLGTSFSEIAAISRSQHKSQGFGSKGTRGRQLEFLEHVKGAKAEKDLFEGIDTSWKRVKGSEKVQALITKILADFRDDNPASITPTLFALRDEIKKLEDSVWKKRKLSEVDEIIRDCFGLYVEATADEYWVAPGEETKINMEIVNRFGNEITLKRISAPDLGFDSTFSLAAKTNIPILFSTRKVIRKDKIFSDPYWLKEPHSPGLFRVNDERLIGMPENPPALPIELTFQSGTNEWTITTPVVYKWTDPVKGELSRPYEIVPPMFVNLDQRVIIFPDQNSKAVTVLIKSASRKSVQGKLTLSLPAGWTASPAEIPFSLTKTGEEQRHTFQVTPAETRATNELAVNAFVDGKVLNRGINTIAYDHIPMQTLLPLATAKLVRLDLPGTTGTIGYLKGAGDDVPVALRNMGYEVWEMKNEEVTPSNLQNLKAVVLGVRALNTNERMEFLMPQLLEYAKKGGTLIVQYNTNFDLETEAFAPLPLTISRDRVTEEDSEVRILKPDHPVLNHPNKITVDDFKGWVQERGLYFPNKWDTGYDALLSMNDKSEPPRDGSLLVAKYGEGHYIYTGLSFFRELPEGVTGAYKLFANLISVGDHREVVAAKKNSRKKRKS
jgi:LmbE family N-acetylglucosaminyl deacetylase